MKPHQFAYWLNNGREEDPEQFDAEVRNVSGLYKEAQDLYKQGIHLVSTDEKTGIQALERKHPAHPMIPGKPELIEFE